MLQEVWLVTKITRLSKKDNVLVPSRIKIVEITQNQIQKTFIEESPTLRAHRDKAKWLLSFLASDYLYTIIWSQIHFMNAKKKQVLERCLKKGSLWEHIEKTIYTLLYTMCLQIKLNIHNTHYGWVTGCGGWELFFFSFSLSCALLLSDVLIALSLVLLFLLFLFFGV